MNHCCTSLVSSCVWNSEIKQQMEPKLDDNYFWNVTCLFQRCLNAHTHEISHVQVSYSLHEATKEIIITIKNNSVTEEHTDRNR